MKHPRLNEWKKETRTGLDRLAFACIFVVAAVLALMSHWATY